MEEVMTGRTKCRTIQNGNSGRKEYIKESDSDLAKDSLKIKKQFRVTQNDYITYGMPTAMSHRVRYNRARIKVQ